MLNQAIIQDDIYDADHMVRAEFWSKDHWSVLAYVETVCVACGGFEVGLDGRMRTNTQNHRVMLKQKPYPLRPGQKIPSVIMDAKHGTHLNNGQIIEDHDDWACIQDLIPLGVFTVSVTHALLIGETLKLSKKGQALVADICRHKAQGGQFSTYTPDAALLAST